METNEIVQRVASGLRKMNKKPIGFLFLDCMSGDYTWDLPTITGVKVFHTGTFLTSSAMDSCNCPWVPMFENEAEDNTINSVWFLRGYEDCF